MPAEVLTAARRVGTRVQGMCPSAASSPPHATSQKVKNVPKAFPINGAYLRMRYTLTCPAAVPNANICFDDHVNLDHV